MGQALERTETRLQRWGNSQGVRIPKEMCDRAGIEVGTPVVIEFDSGVITLRPDRERAKYQRAGNRSLAELCAGAGRLASQEIWGGERGEEVLA